MHSENGQKSEEKVKKNVDREKGMLYHIQALEKSALDL